MKLKKYIARISQAIASVFALSLLAGCAYGPGPYPSGYYYVASPSYYYSSCSPYLSCYSTQYDYRSYPSTYYYRTYYPGY